MDQVKVLPTLYRRLLGLIPRGDERPMPVTTLAQILNVDIRTINSMTYDLVIKYGIPICSYRSSPKNGIFIPVNNEQRSKGLLAQKEQAKSQVKRIEAIETADLNIVYEYEKQYPETKRTEFLIPFTQIKLDV